MWNSMFFYLKKKAKNEQNKQIKYKTSYWKKTVSFSTKVLIDDMPETGLPFYVVTWTMQSCDNFQGKGSTFIFQFNILKTLSFGLAMGMGHVMSASAIICSTLWDALPQLNSLSLSLRFMSW